MEWMAGDLIDQDQHLVQEFVNELSGQFIEDDFGVYSGLALFLRLVVVVFYFLVEFLLHDAPIASATRSRLKRKTPGLLVQGCRREIR
jgi:hypothetical protein